MSKKTKQLNASKRFRQRSHKERMRDNNRPVTMEEFEDYDPDDVYQEDVPDLRQVFPEDEGSDEDE
jgi:hypothetical protein